ncbi:MAG TPA: glutaredoxin family protein [Thermoanaerobaculia bacterium]
MPPVEIVIYSRRDCHLCDEAKSAIDGARTRFRLEIDVREVDIDLDPALRERYNDEVPVVFVAGKKAFKIRVDPEQLAERVRRIG